MVMRVSGFASGMDIDSIVSNMLKAQRAPLNKLLQKKQILEWQRDDYRAMNTALLNFRTNELTSMRLTTNYRTKSVSSSDESKVTATASSAASNASYNISKVDQLATAEVWRNTAEISAANQNVDPSKKLYTSKAEFGTEIVWREGAVVTENLTVAKAEKVFKINGAANIKTEPGSSVDPHLSSWSVKVNGKSFEVVTTGDVANIGENQVFVKADGTLTFKNNLEADSTIRVDYIGISKSEQIVMNANRAVQLSEAGIDITPGTKITLTSTTGDVSLTKEYDVKQDTDSKIMNITEGDNTIAKIDKETGIVTFLSGAPVSDENTTHSLEINYSHKYTTFNMNSETSAGAQYESFIVTGGDSLNSVARKVNDSKVGVSMFFDTATNKMTLTRKETGKFSSGTQDLKIDGAFLTTNLKFSSTNVTKGQNAIFVINGLETNRSSNTFAIDGVTFTLKQKFESPVGSPISINVNNDNNKVYESIKGFIDKYNELIGTISAKTSETRNKDYQPLTDDEREGLSDKQQEKWEEIAKTGLLRRDSILTGTLSQMRTDFYSTVNNNEISSSYNQLAKIGINTSSNYLDGGKLVIDEAKLKATIEADPNSVEQLFRGENGIIQKLTDTVNSAMDKLKVKAGNSFSTNDNFTIGKELNNIAKRQESFEDRLEQLETRYWAQFTAMEKAIQQSNSQSSYLMQYFG